jgi:hypothetical protein
LQPQLQHPAAALLRVAVTPLLAPAQTVTTAAATAVALPALIRVVTLLLQPSAEKVTAAVAAAATLLLALQPAVVVLLALRLAPLLQPWV